MAAAPRLEGEPLVGLVVSENLFRGGDMGYCLVVTHDAIIGAKKPDSWADFEVYLGPGAPPAEASVAEAKKLAHAVSGAREFSVSVGSIGQVLFKRPGRFFGGYVVVKTALTSIRIDMTVISTDSLRLLETSKKLEDALRMVVGERLRVLGTTPH